MYESTVMTVGALSAFLATFPSLARHRITPSSLSDGLIFTEILETIKEWNFSNSGLTAISQGETTLTRKVKITNLESLVEELEEYFGTLGKGLYLQDFDLINVAEGDSKEVMKLFEVVLAALMYSENKEEYIEKIMSLDEHEQQQFATTIQAVMQRRVISLEDAKRNRVVRQVQSLQRENLQLQREVEELTQVNAELEERISGFEESVSQLEETICEKKKQATSEELQQIMLMNQQQCELIESLKTKLRETGRQHEQEMTELTIEMNYMREKVEDAETIEEMTLFYRQKYEDTVSEMNKINLWDKEKVKYESAMEEKELQVNKLQQKIEELGVKNLELENREFDKDMAIEKLQIRVKELQKDIKSRLNSSVLMENHEIGVTGNTRKSNIMITQPNFGRDKESEARCQQLKKLSESYEKKNKELQRENAKLQRKVDSGKVIQLEKRKLEAVIMDLTARKSEELEVVVAALYETQKEYGNLFRAFIKK